MDGTERYVQSNARQPLSFDLSSGDDMTFDMAGNHLDLTSYSREELYFHAGSKTFPLIAFLVPAREQYCEQHPDAESSLIAEGHAVHLTLDGKRQSVEDQFELRVVKQTISVSDSIHKNTT